MSRLSNDGGWNGGFYVEGVDQSLLRDGVEAVRASTVIAEPYVMADKSSAQARYKAKWEDSSQFRSGGSVPLDEDLALVRGGNWQVTSVDWVAMLI